VTRRAEWLIGLALVPVMYLSIWALFWILEAIA
jgi:hypothetical protein